ncbi:monocarboxylate transporter 5-like isoform X2 [Artemia franciscana]|uniref:monocarboxylate transporter 5-like isoform X2 n=1 Tax=Artemia franciscana TaxID=6661 RepID=UPI0032DA6998
MGLKNGLSKKDKKTADALEKTEFFIGDDQRHDDVDISPEYVVPPDGGWGWVIVVASFFCNLVVDGIIFSFGMIMSHLVVHFDESRSKVALVGSLLSGFYLLMGPFVSALANKFGFRAVTIVGSIIGCIGFVLSSFATSVEFLFITYGVIGGSGFGLVYVPAVVAVGFYFEKKRALATGIAVCGSGIGTFLMAPLTTYLINEYGWRGALLIQAGIILNCAVFGAFFRPLEPVRRPEPEVVGTPLMQRIKRARDEKMRQNDSYASFHSGQITHVGNRVRTDSRCSATELPPMNGGSRQMSALSVNGFEAIPENDELPINYVTSLPSIQVSPSDAVIYEFNENGKPRGESFLRNDSKLSIAHSMVSRRSSRASRANLDGSRPLYRDDIFYSASLLRLPQYAAAQDSSKYHASVTRLPTPIPESPMHEKEESCGCCSCLPLESRHVLAKMTHVDLLTSPSFVLISVSSFLTLMGFFVPFMYLTDRALLSNPDLTREEASILISVIGIANTVGRVGCGALADHPKVDSLLVTNVALTIGGIVTIMCPIMSTYTLLMIYAVLFGVSIAAFASLRSILLVELLGLEKLTNAFGLLLLFSGIAATAGGPIAGKFYDATRDYDASFYFSGVLLLLSGVICYPLAAINRWEKKTNEKLSIQHAT